MTESISELLRQARVAKGWSQESLARDLRLPVHLLNAIEAGEWKRVPPGRERPLARLVARKVGLDLDTCREAFEDLPGGGEQEPVNPRWEAMERILMGVLSFGFIVLLAWLVVPGRGLKSKVPAAQPQAPSGPPASRVAAVAPGSFPVLGEVIPEAPINKEGIRVNLRSLDACEAQITGGTGILKHTLRMSEPWSIRVKGPFTLTLDNAGAAEIEVAGRRIQHGKNMGEPWSGSFGADGLLLPPSKPKIESPPTAPETEPESGNVLE